MCVCVCVCACLCSCVYACVRARVRGVRPYGAVVCAVDFQSKYCGFDPCRVRFYTSFFSFSIYGRLPPAECVCLNMCGREKKELSLAKIAAESCVV